MGETFAEKLARVQAATSMHGLYLSPRVDLMPPEIARHDDPFLPYMRAILNATHDLICAYVFDFPAYLRLGAAGMIALERSVALAWRSHVTVLDGRFATAGYTAVWDETAFNFDAVTLAPSAPTQAYIARSDRRAFVIALETVSGPHYAPDTGCFRADDMEVRLMPLETLQQARSVDFEAALRQIVMRHVER